MSSKRGRFENKSPTATPPDITYTDSVNCQWDTCIQQLSCIADLVQHIEKTHLLKGTMKDYVCLWRNCWRERKPFKDRYGLVEHLRTHTGNKPHTCPYQGCDKTFPRPCYLKAHVERRHTREKPYICRIKGCSKSFSNISDRTQHQKMHPKKKPFACTFPGCDKAYAHHYALITHSIQNHTERKKSLIETSKELGNSLLTEGLQNIGKPPNKEHYTHHNKSHDQLSKVEVQTPSLIAQPPQQYLYHADTDIRYVQLPPPVLMTSLPNFNTVFDAQSLANYLPGNSQYSDLQSQSNSPYQSPRLTDFSQHDYNPKRLVMPSLSSMTSKTNLHSYPQSIYKQYVPSHLPPYEDIQYMHYKSPLTATQQPTWSHQQDYFATPTSSMYN